MEYRDSANTSCATCVPDCVAEAKRRGIEVISAPTSEVCELLEEVKKGQAYAILHCTC